MSILKALQKKQSEQSEKSRRSGRRSITSCRLKKTVKRAVARRANTPPELFVKQEFENRNAEFSVHWAVRFFNRDGTP